MSSDFDARFLRSIGIDPAGAERFSGGDLDFTPGPGVITFASLAADLDRLPPALKARLESKMRLRATEFRPSRVEFDLEAEFLRVATLRMFRVWRRPSSLDINHGGV